MMTDTEMLQKLIEAGEFMRYWQKEYFDEKRDKARKDRLFIESKQKEAHFDKCLKTFKLLMKTNAEAASKPDEK